MKFMVFLCLSALTSAGYSHERSQDRQDWRLASQSRQVALQGSAPRPAPVRQELTPDQELIFTVKGVKIGAAFLAGIMTFSPAVVLGVLATDTTESNKDILKINELLAKRANINYKDESGWTPLMYAAHGGHPSIALHLISKGADKDISGPWGVFTKKNYTPLGIAQYHLDTCTRIGQRDGAQPNATEQDYINRYTALVQILGNTR